MLKEVNVVFKKRYDLPFLIAYPSKYRVAISTLPFHTLYFKLNEYKEIYAERAVYDRPSSLNEGFSSIETGKVLKRFKAIFFSIHYELDYVRLVRMLLTSGIGPRRHGRASPLVIVGGPPVTSNPYPLYEIADIIAIGEMEGVLPEVVNSILEFPDDKHRALEALTGREGIFIPGIDEKVNRFWLRNHEMKGAYQPILHTLPKEDHRFKGIYDRAFIVEVSRGCPKSCYFCLLSYHFRPERRKSLKELKGIIERGVRLNPVDSVALISSNYPGDKYGMELLEFIVRELKLKVSIPSIRVESLNESILSLMKEGGQRIVTVAPEVGTESLRKGLNKDVSDDMILNTLRRVKRMGFKYVKMYFMYGLPQETEEDLRAIFRLVSRVKELGFKLKGSIRLSLNPFIPKVGTPMQNHRAEPYEVLKAKQRKLFSYFKDDDTFGIFGYGPRDAIIQATLSTASKDVFELLIRWAERGTEIGHLRGAMKGLGVKDWGGLYAKYGSKSPLIRHEDKVKTEVF